MNGNYIIESEKTWNKIAKSFDSTRQKPWNECIDFINHLKKTDVVLDIACGNGRHLIPCAKKCKKAYGIDISSELIEIIKQKHNLKNIELIHSDAVNLPIKNKSVNAVLFIAALHNIKGKNNRIKSLKEIKRILKKDGTALISVWSRWQDKYRKQFLKKRFKAFGKDEYGDIDIYWRQHGFNIPRFYHLYSKRELQKDLEKSGLIILYLKGLKLHSKKYFDNYFAIVKKE